VANLPSLEPKTSVIDCGVDLERFAPRDAAEARARVGLDGQPPFLACVGSLSERKNVVRLADAFGRLGRGTLAFVGEGELRPELEGRERVHLAGAVPQEHVVDWIAAADVLCQPSLREPFGLAALEGMACARTVVATKIGGPPEFVPPEAGVLVDPHSSDDVERGLRVAIDLPAPNPAAREAAARHDVKQQARRIAEVLQAAAG
jgi:glycosyltransferase involved in cell wall biosynthesis